jgi:hypothetical protein
VLRRDSTLSHKIKLSLYKLFNRAILTHDAPVWSSKRDSNYFRLQVVQNKSFRVTGDYPMCTKSSHDCTTELNGSQPNVLLPVYPIPTPRFNNSEVAPQTTQKRYIKNIYIKGRNIFCCNQLAIGRSVFCSFALMLFVLIST